MILILKMLRFHYLTFKFNLLSFWNVRHLNRYQRIVLSYYKYVVEIR